MKNKEKENVYNKPNNTKEDSAPIYTIYKNRIYKYKDGSTTRVTYDSKDPSYEEIDAN